MTPILVALAGAGWGHSVTAPPLRPLPALPQESPQPTPAVVSLARPFAVAQTVRLAITPTLDGVIADEEWDVLSRDGGCETGFQWEPETLYWAAQVQASEDVVLSLDESADGWLVGDDNLEFRVLLVEGEPRLSVRRLDATQTDGPAWVDAGVPFDSVRIAARANPEGWALEASFRPSAPVAPVSGRRLGLRVDAVPTGADLGPPFMPRPLGFVSLQTDLGQNLPAGFRWRPEALVRDVPVEDEFRLRYAFERTGSVEFTQLEYRVEGGARDDMSAGSLPFPVWSSQGRARFEYRSAIRPDTPVGYRVLRTTLVQPDGSVTVLRSSFQVAELVDFRVDLPKELPPSAEHRIVRGHVVVRSNGVKRVNGRFTLTAPEEWTVSRGADVPLVIYHSRGTAKIPVEVIVPSGTVGTFPIRVEARIGDRVVSKTVYIPVGRA